MCVNAKKLLTAPSDLLLDVVRFTNVLTYLLISVQISLIRYLLRQVLLTSLAWMRRHLSLTSWRLIEHRQVNRSAAAAVNWLIAA